ncbi:MAG: KH domain-containing protein [Mesotoga sp.]|uniref:KH domain-containing protein n=1 Tax=Mesotoga sp. TaxID=2053577 RepID=UPI0016B51D13|nr:KH domain-containing protein [Mesotoga sp.]MDI9368097.1 KH domain-containing protein [Thermotogota bacterium]NLT44236.1 KH domain-containing protein [Thermotogaceae bacterium]MDD2333789.1 KH domain-containing protein [Mesotoga sp.]MDD3680768.1 KH domain-containing protein [Mesotoga sp.]MDD4206714.1 KH domain-containing protein [Mesotoga sp.]
MREVLEHILKGIVREPDQITVSETLDENGNTVFEIGAAEEDVGQIIGKDGRTIKSINVLLNALAGSSKESFILKVVR